MALSDAKPIPLRHLNSKIMRKNLLLTCSLLLAAVFGLRAQGVTTATISGKITDSKGEALPGANVIATHEPSKTTYGSVTLSDGRYIMPAVRVGGPYTIEASFVGYEDVSKTGIELSLGQNFTLDFRLGESSTTLSEIQVSAERDNVLNADRTGASTNIRKEQFERLPTITRSLLDFAALTPQAGSGGGFSFGGRSAQYNNFSIDGATSNNVFGLSALPGGQTNSQPISVDAIQEITVNLAPYDVRQGAFTGAGVNAITRSGTNEFSGSVYGFFRNQDMVGK
ncbi:MAG: carboxypeptidase regulatory-like domain-containing protein, partial [Cytophagales bacterium]